MVPVTPCCAHVFDAGRRSSLAMGSSETNFFLRCNDLAEPTPWVSVWDVSNVLSFETGHGSCSKPGHYISDNSNRRDDWSKRLPLTYRRARGALAGLDSVREL